jgi:hypothetical protein
MVMSVVLSTQMYAMREASGDSLHAQDIDYARSAEQVLVNIIQAQTAIDVSSNGLEAYGMDYTRAFTIRYIDEDDDPTTVENNKLVIDPDTLIDDDETVVCEYVSKLEAEKQPVVRIRNGQELPNGGLSFAADLPVYVEGDDNVDGDVKPALVTGDAVTLLSTEWQDASSHAGIDVRRASSTDYNAVIMTGNTDREFPSVDGEGAYNGGLENVLRFQEKWSGETVTFRGSIIDIWRSETANSPWHYGSYYTALNRDWGYDELYRTGAPPGIPRLFGLKELAWERSTFEAEGWTYAIHGNSPGSTTSPNGVY